MTVTIEEMKDELAAMETIGVTSVYDVESRELVVEHDGVVHFRSTGHDPDRDPDAIIFDRWMYARMCNGVIPALEERHAAKGESA